METYKVINDWTAVKKFAINNLSSFKEEMGFMYRGNEIIVRSHNDQALKILRTISSCYLAYSPLMFLIWTVDGAISAIAKYSSSNYNC